MENGFWIKHILGIPILKTFAGSPRFEAAPRNEANFRTRQTSEETWEYPFEKGFPRPFPKLFACEHALCKAACLTQYFSHPQSQSHLHTLS